MNTDMEGPSRLATFLATLRLVTFSRKCYQLPRTRRALTESVQKLVCDLGWGPPPPSQRRGPPRPSHRRPPAPSLLIIFYSFSRHSPRALGWLERGEGGAQLNVMRMIVTPKRHTTRAAHIGHGHGRNHSHGPIITLICYYVVLCARQLGSW